MKHLTQYILLFVACFLLACQNDNSVVFSYSPTTPRAGQTVSFSNLTDEGEEWAWDFGDGGTSTVKSPNKVYREPGTYTVILKVDDKNYRTCTKTITILDTVPTLHCSVDTIPYFTEVTFRVDSYNPNNETISCKWNLPESAVITSKDTTAATITAYLTQISSVMPLYVGVEFTIGEDVDTLIASFPMKDRPAAGLIIGTHDGIGRQRIYAEGIPSPYFFSTGGGYDDLKQLVVVNDFLYCLNSHIGVTRYYLPQYEHRGWLNIPPLDKPTLCLVAPYFYCYNGNPDYIPGVGIHQYDFSTDSRTLFASAHTLADFPTEVNAIANFNSIFYLAQAKGVYRFTTDMQSLGVILSDYAITQLAVDAMARKLYFIADGALYVSNIDGTSPVQLAEHANTLCVDNTSSRIYYATAEGVVYLPLVQSQNNTTTAEPVVVNNTPNVVALAVDNTAR